MNIHILGTSGAVPFGRTDTTMLAVSGNSSLLLIDCGGSTIRRLNGVSLPWQDLSGILFTHRHIDHIYGFPHLIQALHLINRKSPLIIIGSEDVLEILKRLVELVDLNIQHLSFPLVFQVMSHTSITTGFEMNGFDISTCPVNHSVPTIAYKVQDSNQGTYFVYSGDTGPCQLLTEFSTEADFLIHEASLLFEPMHEPNKTHSTVAEAAEIAAAAKVKMLCLVHFNSDPQPEQERIMKTVMSRYDGRFINSTDNLKISLPIH